MKKSVWTYVCLVCVFSTSLSAAPRQAAIASAHPLATQAGFEILAQGGNAFDAAVAVSAALAVVEPQNSGLGGGGFWLLKRAADGKEVMIDGRETAPVEAAAYFGPNATPPRALPLDGPQAAAIPGLPAALVHLAKQYGRLPLAKSLSPAIRHAETGFPVDGRYIKAVQARLQTLQAFPTAASIFLEEGEAPKPGFRLVQKELAETLRRLARQGHAGFYRGATANTLVAAVREGGGLFSLDDLARYRVVEREPVRGEYRGIRIVSSAPPASGGIVLVEMLNILSAYDLASLDDATQKHLVIEAARRAYRDRDLYLGDPDFVQMPLKQLTSPDYAAGLRVAIRPDRTLPSANLAESPQPSPHGTDTTHFSILDAQGNRVAATLSINQSFGSGFVAQGTGVLLNDEMDDFAAKPGQPNVYGLVGGFANKIEPGKRMLSSMTPTFLETKDRVAILGTPGGSRIISMVLLGVLDFAEGRKPASWVSAGRYHHQYLPDVVEYEPGALGEAEVLGLTKLGHALKPTPAPYGDMHAILWDKAKGVVEAASDPRGEGLAEVR